MGGSGHRSDLFEPPWVRVGCGSGQEKGQNLPTGNLWAGHPRTAIAKIFGYLAFKYIVFVSFIILTLYLSFIILKNTVPSMITIF